MSKVAHFLWDLQRSWTISALALNLITVGLSPRGRDCHRRHLHNSNKLCCPQRPKLLPTAPHSCCDWPPIIQQQGMTYEYLLFISLCSRCFFSVCACVTYCLSLDRLYNSYSAIGCHAPLSNKPIHNTYVIHTYIHTYIHTHIHTYIHIYIHGYVHACMHTYILGKQHRVDKQPPSLSSFPRLRPLNSSWRPASALCNCVILCVCCISMVKNSKGQNYILLEALYLSPYCSDGLEAAGLVQDLFNSCLSLRCQSSSVTGCRPLLIKKIKWSDLVVTQRILQLCEANYLFPVPYKIVIQYSDRLCPSYNRVTLSYLMSRWQACATRTSYKPFISVQFQTASANFWVTTVVTIWMSNGEVRSRNWVTLPTLTSYWRTHNAQATKISFHQLLIDIFSVFTDC